MRKVVYYIDDEKDNLGMYAPILKRLFGKEIELRPQQPMNLIGDMISFLTKESQLGGLVLDFKLGAKSDANYSGFDLAEAMRVGMPKLPIYILTNYAGDDSFTDDPSQVEFVIEKGSINNVKTEHTLTARFRRHQNIFADILSEREREFLNLLHKSTQAELSPEEVKRFKDLQFERSRPTLFEEAPLHVELRHKIDETENVLKKILADYPELDLDSEAEV